MNSISYVLEAEDFEVLAKLARKKDLGWAEMFVMWVTPLLSGFAVLGLLIGLWPPVKASPQSSAWMDLACSVAFWLAVGAYYPISLAWGRRRYARAHIFGDEVKVMIAEPGIAILSEEGAPMTTWQSIERVEETERHLFFYFDQSEALLVPKRAFASESEASTFAAAARKFWRVAHGMPEAGGVPPIAAP